MNECSECSLTDLSQFSELRHVFNDQLWLIKCIEIQQIKRGRWPWQYYITTDYRVIRYDLISTRGYQY